MSPFSRAWAFLGVTCVFTSACQLPGILALRAHEAPSPVALLAMALGSAGPSLVALGYWLQERKRWQRVPAERPAWFASPALLWVCALAFNPLCHLVGATMMGLLHPGESPRAMYLPLLPEQLAIAVIAPLGEEFGFRGYALPRLQTRWSPLGSSLGLGVTWALWHVPTLFVPAARGTTSFELGLYLACYLAGSVVYTWLFNAGRGSIVGPILAHFGIHLDNVFRASAMGDGVGPLASTAVVMMLVAVFLVVTGRLAPETAVRSRPATEFQRMQSVV